jgi:hypothetical protein
MQPPLYIKRRVAEITHATSLVYNKGGLLTRDYLESLKINISTWAGLGARCPITTFFGSIAFSSKNNNKL